MPLYYVSRLLIAGVFAALFYLAGASWWLALLVGLMAAAWFLYAPRSGRYRVNPEGGMLALQRDERGEWINDRAARNAFVALGLALGALNIYFGTIAGDTTIPIDWTRWLLIGAVVVYWVSDLILRVR